MEMRSRREERALVIILRKTITSYCLAGEASHHIFSRSHKKTIT
jgi:hypothetical protein